MASDINFKLIKGPPRDRVLQRLAGNVGLQSRRCAIGRCLIGHDAVEEIEISSRQRLLSQGVDLEEELLFKILLTWCKDSDTATGNELLEVLEMAKCTPRLLSEVKDVLNQHQAYSADKAVDRRTPHPSSDTAEVQSVAPTTEPPRAYCVPAEFMSQMQGMMRMMETFQNSTLQTLTTTVEELQDCIAATEEKHLQVEARHLQLEAEMRVLQSQINLKNPLEEISCQPSSTTAMPGKKAWCQAVHLKDKLVVTGGFSSAKQPCTRVFVLHILSGEWYNAGQTTHALSSATADADGSKMFVIGGCPASGGQAVDTVFTLSSDLQQKDLLPNLILPCCRAASVVHYGKLYVLGGEESWYEGEFRYGPSGTYHLQVLDLKHKTWTLGPRLVHENPWLDCYRLVSLGSLLICDRWHIFDTEKEAWCDKGLPHRPSGFSTAMSAVRNRLLVFGGVNGIDHIHELSNDVKTWRQVGELMIPRRYAAACTIGDSVYVVGGQSCGSFFDTVECFSCA